MKKTFAGSALILILLSFLLSCSGSPPLVRNMDWMFVYRNDLARGGVYEELNFYAQLEDEDGFEDIEELAIFRDDQGWSWKLTPEEWAALSEDGEDWVGAAGLTRSGVVPEGEYRLRISDRSGQTSEDYFVVEKPGGDIRAVRFPTAHVAGDMIQLQNNEREPAVLWFYNDTGGLVKEVYKESGLYPKSELLNRDELRVAQWFMIYHQDETGGYGLKAGPYLMNPPVDTPAAEEVAEAGETAAESNAAPYTGSAADQDSSDS